MRDVNRQIDARIGVDHPRVAGYQPAFAQERIGIAPRIDAAQKPAPVGNGRAGGA